MFRQQFVLKNLVLKKKALMLVRMIETENETKRAVKRSSSAPEAVRHSIPRAVSGLKCLPVSEALFSG